ncbi:MAG: YigZ family protein [Clostridia bacterium]|nr:YigZ family protein [Clostridia bacterium]
MSAGWTTVKEAATASFVERKSEFIGHITPVKTEEEAIAFVNKIKKQYADAKHNVYAYLLRENNITRFSDDGEPHGTAGLPVLDVLRKEGVTDVAVVVTRYFGGILLGTGGLVRAYSQGAKMALDAAGKSVVEKLLVFSLRVNYSDLQKAEPILDNQTLLKLDTVYADDVTIVAAIREAEYPPLEKALTERTNGRAILKVEGERFDCI